MYCRKCGTLLPDDAAFCVKCGQAVKKSETVCADTSMMSHESGGGKQKNKSKTKMFLIAVTAFSLAVVIGETVYSSTRCAEAGCNNKAEYGSYCILHVCAYPNCTFPRSYGSSYCNMHSDGGLSQSSRKYDAETDLQFSNLAIEYNSNYTILTGTLTNNGTHTYKFVEIKGLFKNSAGEVIDTDWTYAVGSEGLEQNESTTFRMSVDKNWDITQGAVSILDYN